MKKIIATEDKPIKLWLDDVEDSALEQAKNLANLPFVFHHIVLLPDSHQGYGMPIGGVMATERVVVPNAVGVDISCGVSFLKTDVLAHTVSRETTKKIMQTVRDVVPFGLNGNHKTPIHNDRMPEITAPCPVVQSQWEKASKSLGSGGSGNHFWELQVNSSGYLCVMIHTGSRNLGKKVADHYNRIAHELNEKYFSRVTRDKQLAFLPMDTEEAHLYIAEMNYCMDFARTNRNIIMELTEQALTENLKDVVVDVRYDVHHNFARMENHFGKNVLVHRKGATSAAEGEIGLIPGSQGTKSYVVRGKGNPQSFYSCSHGAGRRMGRKAAERNLNLEEEIKRLDDQGIIHGIRSTKDLDEAAGAYKNIDEVMANQDDLVEIVDVLTPMAVMKG